MVLCTVQAESKAEDFTVQVANHFRCDITSSGSISVDRTQEVKACRAHAITCPNTHLNPDPLGLGPDLRLVDRRSL